MAKEVAELDLTQEDGEPPAVLAAGSAPGEHGVAVLKVRFEGGLHLGATSPRQHLVWFQLSDVFIECRRATRVFHETAPGGSLAICLAGVDCAADAGQSTDAILVAIEPGYLALAAAEDSALGAQLIECISGHDEELFQLACTLASECAENYPNGALYWSGVANRLLEGLVVRYTSEFKDPQRGRLSKEGLERIRDYVIAHLDEPIEVTALANIVGRSPFHFTRLFSRSVGMTPHRYVVHLRLQRATELIRDRRSGLAEIAACTGFADQSHLSRWVRRVHGVSLTQMVT
jgi:AraC family transcriptional regulator